MLETRSPTTLKLSFAAMSRGVEMDFDDVLRMEFRLAMAVFKMHIAGPRDGDVYEGTHVILVEKKGTPRWSPASVQDVDDQDILSMFAPLRHRQELQLGG